MDLDVLQDLYKEQVILFFKKHRKKIFIFIATIIIFFCGISFYYFEKNLQREKFSMLYSQAMQDIQNHRTHDALSKLENLSRESDNGYYVLAMLQRINITHQLNLFHEMAQSKKIQNMILRQWVKVIDAINQVNNTKDLKKLLPKVAFLLENHAPFRSLMYEAIVGASLRLDDKNLAKKYLSLMSVDLDLPPAIQKNLLLLKKDINLS